MDSYSNVDIQKEELDFLQTFAEYNVDEELEFLEAFAEYYIDDSGNCSDEAPYWGEEELSQDELSQEEEQCQEDWTSPDEPSQEEILRQWTAAEADADRRYNWELDRVNDAETSLLQATDPQEKKVLEEKLQVLEDGKQYAHSRKFQLWARKAPFHRFLDLPAEVRNIIYSYAIADKVVCPYKYTWHPPQRTGYTYYTHPHDSPSALFRINRQIHTEITPLVYSQAAFRFSRNCDIEKLVTNLSAEKLARIRTVTLDLEHYQYMRLFAAKPEEEKPLTMDAGEDYIQASKFPSLRRLNVVLPTRDNLMYNHTWRPGPCHYTYCKWIVKAAKTYCDQENLAQEVCITGGGLVIEEQKAKLADVEKHYKDYSYEKLTVGDSIRDWFPPTCLCIRPCRADYHPPAPYSYYR